MTATRHQRQVSSLITAFCRGIAKPLSPLEDATIHLEADRMRELKTQIKLMPLSCD
jgi:hypothetical protein